MKKSILLILFIALFGAVSELNAQPGCPVARVVDTTCLTADAIHPVPGTAYDYTVTVPTPTTGTNQFLWFVTTDPNFIVPPGNLTLAREVAGGTYLVATGVGYNNPLTGTATINLTWNYFDPTIPVFVIIQVENTNACITQNMKVYKIEPANGFTLDIANVDQAGTMLAGYGANYDFCVHDIVSATYNPATVAVVYDFGLDTMYYIVNAANFTDEWLPTIQVARDASGTGGNMGEIVNVAWARPAAFPIPAGSWTAFGGAGPIYTAPAPVPALDSTGTVGAAGECIVMRVIVDHSTATSYEGIINEQISVAVDGTTQLALVPPLGDIHFSTTIPPGNLDCGQEDGYLYDIALQTITQRPEILDATTPPASDDFLPIEP